MSLLNCLQARFEKNDYSIENDENAIDESKYGRLEITRVNQVQATVLNYGDMHTYPPAVTVEIEDTDYRFIRCMIESVDNGNMTSAITYAHQITSKPARVKIKKDVELSTRMADIEYPFLAYLREKGKNFVLLNPNKGTVKRMQDIFKNSVIPIFMTCMHEETAVRYLAGVEKVNELGWPIHKCSFDSLDRSLLYYGGFTAQQYWNSDIKFLGYEINPASLVQSYEAGKVTSFKDHDHIEVYRDSYYTYVEDYYFKAPYNRYYSDTLYRDLARFPQFFARKYIFLYNIIANIDLGLSTSYLLSDSIPSALGYQAAEGCIRSPYYGGYLVRKPYDVVFKGEVAYPIYNDTYGPRVITQRSPTYRLTYVQKAMSELIKGTQSYAITSFLANNGRFTYPDIKETACYKYSEEQEHVVLTSVFEFNSAGANTVHYKPYGEDYPSFFKRIEVKQIIWRRKKRLYCYGYPLSDVAPGVYPVDIVAQDYMRRFSIWKKRPGLRIPLSEMVYESANMVITYSKEGDKDDRNKSFTSRVYVDGIPYKIADVGIQRNDGIIYNMSGQPYEMHPLLPDDCVMRLVPLNTGLTLKKAGTFIPLSYPYRDLEKSKQYIKGSSVYYFLQSNEFSVVDPESNMDDY